MPTYTPLLEKLNEAALADAGFPMDRCPLEEAERFAARVKTQLGVDLPQEYIDFIQEADGFAENGVFLYSVDQEDPEMQGMPSVINENIQWGIAAKAGTEWLYLGHSDLWLYGQNLQTKKFHALYKDTVKSIKEFESFDNMVTNMMKEALGLPMQ